jgi:3-oxoacyl-[acyl-carrier protein] reductase
MDMMLKDRVAIVTGAARGMGRAIAEALDEEGAKVVMADVAPVEGVQVDVSNRAQVEGMVRSVIEKFGTVDILVNNAGIIFTSRFPEATEEEWDLTLDVNLKGMFLCTKAVLPLMREKGYGRVVNISSTAGKTVSTLGGAHYTASKHGVLGLTRAFAREAAPWGITCNAVCPGLIDTAMVRESITEERIRAYEEKFPVGRIGDPHEVAALVTFLASGKAAYITGAAIDINGGDLMV